MARSKNKLAFVPPDWHQALRARFLDYGFLHNPSALRQLATDVRSNAMTTRQWASQYHLEETWVEEWVGDVLEVWRNEPYLVSEVAQRGDVKPPGTIRYPLPRDGRTADDPFSYSVSTVPTSNLSLGITMGGSVPDDEPDDDRLRFRKQVHTNLDHALDLYYERVVCKNARREVIVPKDLLRKTEVTAVYLFCSVSPENMLPKLLETVGSRITVYRWIKQIADLLEIPIQKRTS